MTIMTAIDGARLCCHPQIDHARRSNTAVGPGCGSTWAVWPWPGGKTVHAAYLEAHPAKGRR